MEANGVDEFTQGENVEHEEKRTKLKETTGVSRNKGGVMSEEDWEKSLVSYKVREQELKGLEVMVQEENSGVSKGGGDSWW